LITTLISIEIAAAIIVFVILFFISAPYGRHVRKGWGPVIGARWAWMIMEFPAFFVIAAVVIPRAGTAGPFTLFFLCLWEMHYVYRVFAYPFLLTTPKKPFPLLIVFFAICFNTLNGFVNGTGIIDSGLLYSVQTMISGPRFVCGIILFLGGYCIHMQSDAILRRLRKDGKGEYLVPDGGLFKLVANPNYLGEIIEWTGWALGTWSMAGLAFMLFTIANLLPRAVSNYRWYRETFPAFPSARKILIPFVW
jgi:protein-S-isoprenylcysteine O-methyltransferase Ste14